MNTDTPTTTAQPVSTVDTTVDNILVDPEIAQKYTEIAVRRLFLGLCKKKF